MQKIDLHTHTTASDGRLTPRELVERALVDGVNVIAVTDHDTVDGIDEALAEARGRGVSVIPGIELSARHDGRNVHVLGLFLDHAAPSLRETLVGLRADRLRRGRLIVDKLRDLNHDITWNDVCAQSGDGVVGRPHIARALVAKGCVSTVREAFSPGLIADGGLADVAKQALSPVEAVRVLRDAGGVAVVAHPGVGHHEGRAQPLSVELLTQMRDAGMAGLEVDHPDHDPITRERLREVARELGLIVTGGSDFHGDEGHVIGRATTSPESLDALRAKAV
jgi:predicted metal-dependent phosphoesterase TrpH